MSVKLIVNISKPVLLNSLVMHVYSYFCYFLNIFLIGPRSTGTHYLPEIKFPKSGISNKNDVIISSPILYILETF